MNTTLLFLSQACFVFPPLPFVLLYSNSWRFLFSSLISYDPFLFLPPVLFLFCRLYRLPSFLPFFLFWSCLFACCLLAFIPSLPNHFLSFSCLFPLPFLFWDLLAHNMAWGRPAPYGDPWWILNICIGSLVQNESA